MSATSHEAPYVLDGLMHHGTALRIGTHYTDTGGASDHVFILCTLLGFRFCPRLRDSAWWKCWRSPSASRISRFVAYYRVSTQKQGASGLGV
jgi:TnpA family transposase